MCFPVKKDLIEKKHLEPKVRDDREKLHLLLGSSCFMIINSAFKRPPGAVQCKGVSLPFNVSTWTLFLRLPCLKLPNVCSAVWKYALVRFKRWRLDQHGLTKGKPLKRALKKG